MGNAKPLASLSSGLLARPGQAKPAMRRQVFTSAPTEDLGWNDMGHAPAAEPPVAAVAPPPLTPVPPVLIERSRLTDAIKPTSAPPVVAPRAEGRKAAFTLRLDADRHLRLRLASAVAGRSSQQLLVAALDAFLASQTAIEALARQVPAQPFQHDTDRFSGEK